MQVSRGFHAEVVQAARGRIGPWRARPPPTGPNHRLLLEIGDGLPLILVAGALSTPTGASDIAALLGASFTAVAYDRRGRGQRLHAPIRGRAEDRGRLGADRRARRVRLRVRAFVRRRPLAPATTRWTADPQACPGRAAVHRRCQSPTAAGQRRRAHGRAARHGPARRCRGLLPHERGRHAGGGRGRHACGSIVVRDGEALAPTILYDERVMGTRCVGTRRRSASGRRCRPDPGDRWRREPAVHAFRRGCARRRAAERRAPDASRPWAMARRQRSSPRSWSTSSHRIDQLATALRRRRSWAVIEPMPFSTANRRRVALDEEPAPGGPRTARRR